MSDIPARAASDPSYERPILARYLDPVDVIWLATARRLGLRVRRNPSIFSATDGEGLLELGPRSDLDADDTVAQMIFHELCHWVVNGVEVYHQRDWGFALDVWDNVQEHAALRLQAWWSGQHGLRDMFGPTGAFRGYFDQIPADPFEALDGSDWERRVVALTRQSVERASAEPFAGPVAEALAATAAIRAVVRPFLPDYATEIEADPLPSLWAGIEAGVAQGVPPRPVRPRDFRGDDPGR